MLSHLTFVATNFILGAGLGAVGGLFGIGGGLIAIPLLGLIYHMDQHMAQGTALLMVAPNVLIGFWQYRQKHGIELHSTVTLGLPAILSSYAAAHLVAAVDGQSLRLAFAVFLALLALYLLWQVTAAASTQQRATPLSRHLLPVIGLLGGAMSGFFTVGGGVVVAPILVRFFGVTQTVAQGYSLAMVTPGAFVALGIYGRHGQIDWGIGLPLALGGMLSISWGVALAHRLPERYLRTMFCGALMGTAWLIVHA